MDKWRGGWRGWGEVNVKGGCEKAEHTKLEKMCPHKDQGGPVARFSWNTILDLDR